jgi:hypothetical protein
VAAVLHLLCRLAILFAESFERRETLGVVVEAYSRLAYVGAHVTCCLKDNHNAGYADRMVPEHVLCCSEKGHLPAYANTDFSASFRGIPVAGRGEFLAGGCYATTAQTEEFEAWSGSCTGYGYWRADLQKQFNPVLDPDGPFYELIWFSDCEGTIGSEAAGDLLADFREHSPMYRPPYEWYGETFEAFTRACSLAADGGLIDFW